MGVTAALLRTAAASPHVLLAVAPGATAVRLAAEAELRRRGWPVARAPANADVLLVAGQAEGDFGQAVEAVWQAVPAPRARAQARHPGDVAAVLEAARSQLGDVNGQRAAVRTARHRGNRGDGDMGGSDDHTGQGGDGTDMPGGLAMADRGEDRDKLKLDQLHVPLGPLLPDWPAGLVVRVTLQGDVIQQAAATVAAGEPGGGGSHWDVPYGRAAAGEHPAAGEAARWRLAAHLDSLGRFLAVAGWDAAAVNARRLRDETLAGAPASKLAPFAGRFARRVARSRVLAWSTRGLGVLGPGEALAAGVGGPALRAGGDVCARYRQWCAEAARAAAALPDRSPADPDMLEGPRGPLGGSAPPSAALVGVLPGLLAGAEFAAARLIIASLDPDPDELAAQRGGAADGG